MASVFTCNQVLRLLLIAAMLLMIVKTLPLRKPITKEFVAFDSDSRELAGGGRWVDVDGPRADPVLTRVASGFSRRRSRGQLGHGGRISNPVSLLSSVCAFSVICDAWNECNPHATWWLRSGLARMARLLDWMDVSSPFRIVDVVAPLRRSGFDRMPDPPVGSLGGANQLIKS
ncbi:hypothetical protein EJ04DRAFT_550495 [Polyplosphaeria fusca]|uniref:Uncharacterized protein n=1 Tax=Polyplosphaeria fusca TaxID=682080 RepID=A0A9P4R2M8_9PLEO|nr:hypothetical protein EJ04DRAFT_550495 [Polyplosphaeria fusca]